VPWPTPQDYNEAIQSPAICFADGELRASVVETTALGLPRPITGNFASVYRVSGGGRDWALRCFWRDFSDLGDRYAAISAHLGAARLPYTVPFEYLQRGIRVQGAWYPILKMAWSPGVLLDRYVEAQLGNPEALCRLSETWLALSAALERAGLAHGDLQHGNVMVDGGRLVLVDYDGMFVPSLGGRGSHETGHPNYQHPARVGADFGPYLDRFSAWSIYLSLRALAGRPELWTELGGGDECLLFRAADFRDASRSRAFAALDGHPNPDVVALAERLRSFLDLPPSRVPPLQLTTAVTTVAPVERRVVRSATRVVRFVAPEAPREVALLEPSAPAGPDWLADHLPAPQEPPFDPPVTLVRRGAAIAVLAVLAAIALIVVVPSYTVLALGVLLCALVMTAALPVVSYRRLDVVLDLRDRLDWATEVDRDLDAVRGRIDAWEAERRRAGTAYDDELRELTTERAGLTQREAEERAVLRSDWEARAATLDESLRRTTASEVDALTAEITELQRRHVRETLRHSSLRGAQISGIGWSAKLKLFTLGVWAAADLTAEKIQAIGVLDEEELLAVVTWRVERERAARRSAPQQLPADREERITRRYGRERERLQASRRSQEARYHAQDAAVVAHYAQALADLQAEEEATLAARAQDLLECDDAIAALEVELPPLESERLEALHALYPYRSITFARYLRAILGRA
jgi:hypothetical protein